MVALYSAAWWCHRDRHRKVRRNMRAVCLTSWWKCRRIRNAGRMEMRIRRIWARWLFISWFAAMPVLAGWAVQRNAGPDAQNWPQWRGPEGNGVSHAVNLPVTWGPDKNIA